VGAEQYLGVARFNKPHGLKGEALLYALTSDPDAVFVPGRELVTLDATGNPAGEPVTIERARRYHREWLVKFRGIEERTPLETWSRQALLGMPKADLTPPKDDQLYLHEIPGTPVLVGEQVIGVAKEILSGPAGELLALEVNGKELLVPFRKPFVKRVDRVARQIELDPPPGLLDL
jgi:16S rRNA processing protein RimM